MPYAYGMGLIHTLQGLFAHVTDDPGQPNPTHPGSGICGTHNWPLKHRVACTKNGEKTYALSKQSDI